MGLNESSSFFASLRRRLFIDSLRQTAARNMGVSLLVKLLSLASGLLTQLVLARLLGVAEFGVYAFVWAIFLTCLIVCTWGFPISAIRFVASYQSQAEWPLLRGFIRQARLLVLGISLLVAVVGAGILPWLSNQRLIDPALGQHISLALLLLPLYALLEVQAGILRGANQLLLALLSQNVFFHLFTAGLVQLSLLVIDGLTVNRAILLSGGGIAFTVIIQHFLIVRRLPALIWYAPSTFQTREWLRVSGVLMVGTGLEQLMRQLDVLVLGSLVGTTASGIYVVAARFASLVNVGLQISNQSTAHLYPSLYVEKRTSDLQKVVSFTTLVTVVTTLPLVLALIFWPQQILGWFGETFAVEGALVIQILLFGQFINALSGPNGVLMQMTNHQDEMVWIIAIACVLQFILLTIFALRFGLVGVALATSVTIAFRNIIVSLRVRRHLGINPTFFSRSIWRGILQAARL
ncbi:MAG: hypothetical protein DCC55_20720 [Chloroflexi bacterium]|nr:MAG: hypothetical protein DCC55_20720 [Chloroflexota bacterium]